MESAIQGQFYPKKVVLPLENAVRATLGIPHPFQMRLVQNERS